MGRLIALVSGGKDSILSLMLSVAHGHEIAYLANLYPVHDDDSAAAGDEKKPNDDADDEEEDLDSYCFQTVGFKAVPALAEALQIPLRRRAIRKGQSVATGLVYDTPQTGGDEAASAAPAAPTDEVEELYELLRGIVEEAKADGNPVTGVCSGAILSDYQRLRVEHVCGRLGLLSYAYLWQMPQERVLDLVGRMRVEAILIKVASMGLVPRKHLGRDLAALAPYLVSLAPDVHPAGEGGEFESFVLGCPLVAPPRYGLALTRKRVVDVDENPISPTGFLSFAVAPRSGPEERPYDEAVRTAVVAALTSGTLRTSIALRDAAFAASGLPPVAAPTTAAASDDEEDNGAAKEVEAPEAVTSRLSAARFPRWLEWKQQAPTTSAQAPGTFYVVTPTEELMSTPPPAAAPTDAPFPALYHRRGADPAASAGDQVRSIFASLDAATRKRVFYTMVMLPTLDAFLEINKAYVEFFGVSPPSRAVVECDKLSAVTMDIYLTPDDTPRDVLHVQSISAWAAACIGPYAQANRIQAAPSPVAGATRVLATAGVLGLEPGSMTFPGLPGAATPVDRTGGLTVHDRFLCEFRVCIENLRATLERMGTSLAKVTHAQVFVSAATDEVHRDTAEAQSLISRLWTWASDGTVTALPPKCRVVVLSKLPRGALVEIQAILDDAWWVVPAEADDGEGHECTVAPVQRDNAFWVRPGLHQQ